MGKPNLLEEMDYSRTRTEETNYERELTMDAKKLKRRGEDNGNAHLTEGDVLEIRRLWGAYRNFPMPIRKQLEVTNPTLASSFGVCRATISDVVRRNGWDCVDEQDAPIEL